MAIADRRTTGLTKRRVWNTCLALALAGFAIWAIIGIGHGMVGVGTETLNALWLLPALMGLSLLQLFLSAIGWGILLPAGPRLSRLYRLRIIREGIDSLLPVAQIGGEIVGAQLLAQDGVTGAMAGASVVVDVTAEFLTQVVFLVLGITALTLRSPSLAWESWSGAALVTATGAAGLLLAQRVGLLRMLEALARQIARRWPAAATLTGMDVAAAAMYGRTRPLLQLGSLHLVAWVLGTLESWAVLHAIGLAPSLSQGLVVEALGMAARSAGFAVPGALVVQETGFALAAAAAGFPEAAGLAISLVKRAREVGVGLIGIVLWRLEVR